MKKLFYVLSLLIIASMALAACGATRCHRSAGRACRYRSTSDD